MNTSFNNEEIGKMSKDFLERLMNWTFPGATLYYRDTKQEDKIISKYRAGQIIRSRSFVDVSGFAGKPTGNCRFIIASSKAAPVYAQEPVDPKTQRWRMHVINANSYFKVLDIYRKNGQTQIFLLHIPAGGIEVFRSSVFDFGEGSVEKQFIERARASFDKRLEMPPALELEEKEWLERTDFPIGLDVDGQFFPLEPEFDIFGQSDVVERFITLFKWTDDDLELNLFPVLKPEDEKPEGGTGNTHPAYGPVLKVFASVELDADPPNYGKAFEYYRIAAEKGRDPEAQYNLGILYANGQGTEKNLLLAAYWLRQAGEANFHDAQATESQVTFMYLDENIRTRTAREVFQAAIDYYRTLFGMENAVVEANALIDAISKYYVKEDENKDYVCALKCFRAMAEFGDSDSAMYNVGLCHLHGWGTPEEHPAALYWFDRAADCGNEQAGERRDGLIDVYRRGSGNAGAKNLLELLALWCRTGMPEVMHDERKSKYWEAKAKELICDGKRK